MSLIEAVKNNLWTIIFYTVIILLLYINRKKFQYQGVIAIYKTKIGIGTMNNWAKRFGPSIRFLGYVGIVVAFLAMIFMVAVITTYTYKIISISNNFNELISTPPAVAPLIPGVSIPGVGFHIPLVSGFICIFLIILVHEFAHGVLSRAHNIPVKNTGYLQLLIIPGAFVEPDEKKLTKAPVKTQLSIFAAGAFTNFIFAIIALLLIYFCVAPAVNGIADNYFNTSGFTISAINSSSPAEKAGLKPNTVYNRINGRPVLSAQEVINALSALPPGSNITFSDEDNNSVLVTSQSSAQNSSRGYIGIYGIETYYTPAAGTPSWLKPIFFGATGWISELFIFFVILNLAVGTVNLLPLGPLDGGRMFQLLSNKIFGEKNGKKLFLGMSIFILAMFVILILHLLLHIFVASVKIV